MAKRKRKQKGSLWKSHGSWYVRYREPDGTPVAYKLGSVKEYPRKGDVLDRASEYMRRVNQSVAAGTEEFVAGTVSEFFEKVFVPTKTLEIDAKTMRNYKQFWRLYLEPQFGKLRLRDVTTGTVQKALQAIHKEHGNQLGHATYGMMKRALSAIFGLAKLLDHILVNPVQGSKIKGMGHYNHRENGAYTLKEIQQFLTLFADKPKIAATIGINAFLGLRGPEVEALDPSCYNGETMRIPHPKVREQGQNVSIPVIAPLRKLLPGWTEKISLENTEYAIKKRLEGTGLRWRGWYAFRRGLATNLWELGVDPKVIAVILRNSEEVTRRHYIKLLEDRKHASEGMNKLEAAFERAEMLQKAETGRPQ